MPFTAEKRDLDLKRLLKGLAELQLQPDISITEVFFPSDARAQTPQCKDAIDKEINGLIKRGVFKTVKLKDVPHGLNVPL